MWNNGLTTEGAIALVNALVDAKILLYRLVLSGNNIDDKFIHHLGKYLIMNPSLDSIDIGYNTITDEGLSILSQYIIGNRNIRTIGLAGNIGITTKSIPLLIHMIEQSDVEDVNVNGASIKQVNALALPLARNRLRIGSVKFGYSYKDITDDDLFLICQEIEQKGNIQIKEIM